MNEVAAASPGLFDVELPPAPYPGLRPFERHEWPIFFGRETMTGEAIRRLLDQNLLVVHGDSGCGKSSLIRAGVLVQLEQRHARGAQRWRTCTMLPREAPLRRMAEALAGLKESEPSPDLVRQIGRALNAGHAAAARLEELLCTDPADRICILVDQFEELFRFAKETSADEARLLVDVLVGLLDQADRRREAGTDRLRLYAVLTMRSEFLGVCARFPGLAEAVNRTQYLLPQMERPALLRAIREPARLYDGEVSRELAERLIADAGGGQDQLPLIQHGLMLLWQRKAGEPKPAGRAGLADQAVPFRHPSGPTWRLDLGDYQGAGGLADLLSKHADKVMAEAAPDAARQKIVEHLFRALTDINAEGHAIRRPQTFAQLRAVTGADEATLMGILDAFRAEGISFLTPYGDAPIHSDTQIDISHEALIRCWLKIADEDGWQQQEFQDGLVWKSLLVQAGKRETLSSEATVARGKWLRTLPSEVWCKRYGGGWVDIQELMQASRKARERQITKDRRVKRWLAAAAVLFLVLGAVAWLSYWQSSVAQREAQLGDSLYRAEQARGALKLYRAEQARGALKEDLPVTAMQLALAGLPQDRGARPWVGETAGALVEARGEATGARLVLRGDEGSVTAAGYSPDGARIVSGSWDDTVRVWDAASGAELLVLRGHEEDVAAAGYSPDGARIVTGSWDNTVRVWDASSGDELLVLRGHQEAVDTAGFSPDGARIVSGSWDDTVRVWDASSGAELLVLRLEDSVFAAWFSPDGARIKIGLVDGTLRETWTGRSKQELIDTARARLPRELTDDERRRFYLTTH